MCPSIGGNVGETWLRRGPIITPPYLYLEKKPLCKFKSLHLSQENTFHKLQILILTKFD